MVYDKEKLPPPISLEMRHALLAAAAFSDDAAVSALDTIKRMLETSPCTESELPEYLQDIWFLAVRGLGEYWRDAVERGSPGGIPLATGYDSA